jgi:competence protein ComEC
MGNGLDAMAGALMRQWARRPLFALASGLVSLMALDHFSPDFLWAGGLVFAALVLRFGGWKTGIIALVIAATVLGGGRFRDARQVAEEARFSEIGLADVEARLSEDAVGEAGTWSAVARLRGDGYGGRKVRWIGTGEPPPAGTELKASGVFGSLGGERNPGVPDRAERLRNEGVVAVFRANGMRSEQWIGPVSSWAAGIKMGFRESITVGLDEESLAAKVIRAVVLGERARDSLGLVRSFRESGTLHVFTVSGMHVMMLGSMIWFVLKWSGVPRRAAIPAIIAAMFGYAWLTGNGPAAVRAAWMGSVFLGAFAFRRRPDLLNALGAVLIVSLLFDHRMIRMPGVQLSYGVVAAIGLWTALARRCFSWIAADELFLPTSETGFWQRKWSAFRRKLAEALAVSTAASVGSLPLGAFHFGIVAPVSVFATVALVPIVYVLLGAALVSAMLRPLSESAAVYLNRTNALAATACAKTAGFFASLPGASGSVAAPKTDTLIIYDLGYGAAAACFTSVLGNSVLLDTGGKFSLESQVGPSLMRLGIRPDAVIFTHADAGHAAPPGLLMEMFPLRQVASGMVPSQGSVAAEWTDFSAEGVRVFHSGKGQLLDLGGGAWAEVLLSPSDGHLGSLADDRAMVLRLHWKGWKILFTGDAGRLSEEALLESGADLGSDVIVGGLHESDFSLTEPFVSAVNPQVIIVASPAGSEMDRLRENQKKSWERKGMLFLDQRLAGGLTVTVSVADDLIIQGFADGSETVIPKP